MLRFICRIFAVVVLIGPLWSCTKLNSGVVGMFDLDTDLKLVLVGGEDINPD